MKLKIMTAFAVLGLVPTFVLCGHAAAAQELLTRDIAIARVVAAAPSLDAMRETVAASEAAIQQAGVKPNPFLSTGMEDFTGTGPFTELGRSEITFNYNQRFERGGKRRSRVRFAKTDKRIAIARWQIRRLDIIWQAEQAYIAVLVAQVNLDNLTEQAKIVANIHSAIKERMARGKDSELAGQNASLRLSRSRYKVAHADRQMNIAKRFLASLWQQPDAVYTVDSSPLFFLPSTLQAPSIDAATSGPDIQIWMLQHERSGNVVTLEKAKAVQDPTFNLGLRYLQGTSDVSIVAGVSIPLALYDTNSGNISKARAHVRKSQHDLLDAERVMERRILLQQNNRAAAYVQAKQMLTELIPEATQTTDLVLRRLKQGVASYLDVFAAQSLTAELQGQLTMELEQYQLAQAELNRLTGRYADENALTEDNASNVETLQDSEGN